MNSYSIDWVVLATVAAWAALLWWTLRIKASTKGGVVLKLLIAFLLICFGAVMLWNIFQVGYRAT
jgi:hypothetical protein